MKNLNNKIIEVKKLLDEKTGSNNEFKLVSSNASDNLTPQMKIKINRIETHSPSPTKKKTIITTVDDSSINLNMHNIDSKSLKKDGTSGKDVNDVMINPLSYLLKDGSINFSKILIDEVLAADKLLIEAAKLTYDIAGNYIVILIIIFVKYQNMYLNIS